MIYLIIVIFVIVALSQFQTGSPEQKLETKTQPRKSLMDEAREETLQLINSKKSFQYLKNEMLISIAKSKLNRFCRVQTRTNETICGKIISVNSVSIEISPDSGETYVGSSIVVFYDSISSIA
jgi:hypothetical protein